MIATNTKVEVSSALNLVDNKIGSGCGLSYQGGHKGFAETGISGKPQWTEVTEMDFLPNNGLGQLILQLREILGHKLGLGMDEIDIDTIKRIMTNYKAEEEEWAPYALHDKTKNYSRNGIVNINDNANLLILVWSPQKGSPVHDHAKAHCCMKILKGELEESVYDMPKEEGEPLQNRQRTILSAQEVGYISDSIGLHKMSNPQQDEVAVSLHLYTPPYALKYGCCTYEQDGRRQHVDMGKYHSWQGKLI